VFDTCDAIPHHMASAEFRSDQLGVMHVQSQFREIETKRAQLQRAAAEQTTASVQSAGTVQQKQSCVGSVCKRVHHVAINRASLTLVSCRSHLCMRQIPLNFVYFWCSVDWSGYNGGDNGANGLRRGTDWGPAHCVRTHPLTSQCKSIFALCYCVCSLFGVVSRLVCT
jgi:hypothetical protein